MSDLNTIEINSLKWYYERSPIGYRIVLRNHPSLNCGECSEGNGKCINQYSCTCYIYTYENRICEHINLIYEKTKNFKNSSEPYEHSVEELLQDVKLDEQDKFDYKSYYANRLNFDMNLISSKREFYWSGYESTLVRHEHGLQIQGIKIEKIGKRKFQIDDMNFHKGVRQDFQVELFPKKNCEKCAPYQQCSVCRFCYHQGKCSCEDFQNKFFCRHLHAVTMKLYPERNSAYFIILEHEYIRNVESRHYFLWIQTRVRHNKSLYIRLGEKFMTYFIHDKESDDEFTTVQRYIPPKECQCNNYYNRCYKCRICIHSYRCNCRDYKAGFICIHLHATHMKLRADQIRCDKIKKRWGGTVFDTSFFTTSESLGYMGSGESSETSFEKVFTKAKVDEVKPKPPPQNPGSSKEFIAEKPTIEGVVKKVTSSPGPSSDDKTKTSKSPSDKPLTGETSGRQFILWMQEPSKTGLMRQTSVDGSSTEITSIFESEYTPTRKRLKSDKIRTPARKSPIDEQERTRTRKLSVRKTLEIEKSTAHVVPGSSASLDQSACKVVRKLTEKLEEDANLSNESESIKKRKKKHPKTKSKA